VNQPEMQGDRSHSQFPLRWWPAAVIVVLGVAAILFAWFGMGFDRTYQVFSLWVLVPLTLLALAVWWVFGSRLSWKAKGVGVLLCVVGLSVVRLEEYEGDMVPVVRFRWQPTREQVTREYFASVPEPTLEAAGKSELLLAGEGDWPEFRGSGRDGVVRGVQLSRDWSTEPPRELWRHPVGQAWSSFAVVAGRVYTQEQRDQIEVVSCWDLVTGDAVWVHRDDDRFNEAMGGPGPRATPTFDNSRIYSLGANGRLNCLDASTGRSLWETPPNVLEATSGLNLDWAMSGSPLVVDGRVIVIPGGSRGGVAAFDAETGELSWSSGNRPASYASPRLFEMDGRVGLLCFGGDGLTAYAIEDGVELWHLPWTNGPKVNAALPVVVSPGRLLVSSGYSTGCAMLELGGAGAVPSIVWQNRLMRCKFNDPVVRDGFAYGLDEGILVCLDLETGRRKWKRGRYGYGQLLLVGDVIVVQAERGEVVLVEANSERFRELGKFPALEAKTWNHPVLVGNRLLVRNAEEMACFELPVR
jgi:outer membrane protein assembly factor BamB